MIRQLYRVLRAKLGLGSPVAPQIWNRQFGAGEWDFLEGADESAHYEAIVALYKRFCDQELILDIGCGNGVLFKYLKEKGSLPPSLYHGIDLSSAAIAICQRKYPEAHFAHCDFDSDEAALEKRAGVIVFNETLYYFSKPLQTLKKAQAKHLKRGGHFIISMCEYPGHDQLWTSIEACYERLDRQTVTNQKGQVWSVRAFRAE